jgi:hypothetical protein
VESSDAKILAIDSKGVARAKLLTGTGNPLIRGSDPATGLYQSTTAYVEMPGVKSITFPQNISIVSGDAMPVTAMAALYGGGEMTVNDLVQWTSSDSNVAEMISSGALVQGRAQGGATIEALNPRPSLPTPSSSPSCRRS